VILLVGGFGDMDLAIMDSLDHQVAVIDRDGMIVATNKAWNQFCLNNDGIPTLCGIGMNYLEVSNEETVNGIKSVLEGREAIYKEEYPCHSPEEKRWFILNVTPFVNTKSSSKSEGAVVMHLNITERKLLELAQEKELELAKSLQHSVLIPPLHSEKIEIEGVYLPSSQLSGDMYAWYRINESQFGIILLDIIGHGVSSSLISMSIRALLEGIIKRAVTPADVYQELNKHFRRLFGSKMKFCTGIYLLVDTEKKSIQYVNAASPHGLVIGDHKVQVLNEKTVPIGVMDDPEIRCGTAEYTGGEMVILYTDGLADSLKLTLSECEDLVKSEGNKRIHHLEIDAFVKELLKDADQMDDVTAVSVRFRMDDKTANS
jgi:phosphoserine phosphatase RsbU/P